MSVKLDFPLIEVEEGSARFYIPKVEGLKERGPASSRVPVFYNPAMKLNRDIAVLFLKAVSLSHRVKRVCEPMAGCGVRGLRFLLEVSSIELAVLNDLNPRAFKLSKLNLEKAGAAGKTEVHNLDAEVLLARYTAPGERFDYVDLDPYGSPIPYLDSCLRSVRGGGFLALTATDMPVLCGANPKACLRKYGAKPLKVEYCHELAARILLAAAVRLAARRDLALQPLFTHTTDHYTRLYLQVLKGARRADKALEQLGRLHHCPRCLNREVTRGLEPPPALKSCPECGGPMEMAGPLWLGNLWNGETVEAMARLLPETRLAKPGEASSLLEKVKLEARVEAVGYYTVDRLAEKFKGRPPSPASMTETLRGEGFNSSLTHFNPQGFRTEAPHRLVVEAFRKLSSQA